ncbi:MAG: TonB-dependent receptor family protein [Alphaproteobacteria bacterium]
MSNLHRPLLGVSTAALLAVAAGPALGEPLTTPPLNITITKGIPYSPVGTGLDDPVVNPGDGSLTAPSIDVARAAMSQIPGAVDLVPSEAYRDRYTRTFRDTLSNTPGVFAQPRFGEEVRLSIRGSGMGRAFHMRGINILQDGVPTNLADGNGDFQEIDPLIARYTEVYKGGNGLQWGTATLGGAINIVTPTGHTAPDRNLVRLEGGSEGTGRLHGAVARVIGDWDGYVAATGVRSDGWREQSTGETGRIGGNVGYRISPDAETRLYVAYNHIDQELPGSLSLYNALNNPQSANRATLINDHARDIRSLRVANKTSLALDDRLNLDLGVYGAWKKLYHPIFQVVDQKSLNLGTYARLQGETDVAGHRNVTIIGTTLKTGTLEARQYVNVQGSRGARTAYSDQDANAVDLYAENRFYLRPDLSLVLGTQYLYATRDYTNHLNTANNASATYDGFSPKAGVVWDALPEAQLFANVSRSLEPPTYVELVQGGVAGFVPLDAQEAWTFEIGTRGRYDRAAWDATYYRSWVRGEMLNFSTGPGIPASTFNAADTLHQGVELGFDLDVGRGWLPGADAGHNLTLRQVYNFSDFTFVEDAQYGDNRIAGLPVHYYRAELKYRHPSGVHVAPNFEWVPVAPWADYANTLRASSYVLLGLSGGYDMGNGASFFLDARNLTNERYISNLGTITDARTANSEVFYPGDGRTVFGGVRIGF